MIIFGLKVRQTAVMETFLMNTSSTTFNELKPEVIVGNWMKASNELYQWLDKLNQIIQEPASDHDIWQLGAFREDSQLPISKLRQVRFDLVSDLKALKSEFDSADEGFNIHVKLKMLIKHTACLVRWSNRIQHMLGFCSVASA